MNELTDEMRSQMIDRAIGHWKKKFTISDILKDTYDGDTIKKMVYGTNPLFALLGKK